MPANGRRGLIRCLKFKAAIVETFIWKPQRTGVVVHMGSKKETWESAGTAVSIFNDMTLRRLRLCGSMLPHNRIINKDQIWPKVLNKYNLSQVQYKLLDDGRRPKYVGAIFVYILM